MSKTEIETGGYSDDESDSDVNRLKTVGRGLEAPSSEPGDPQVFLHRSNHPYSPFTGNALKWDCWTYDDGAQYEGLTRDEAPHVKGTYTVGTDTETSRHYTTTPFVKRHDKYEGEIDFGFWHGLGQYTSMTGEVYRGEWVYGLRHGCGVLIDQRPFLARVGAGMDPEAAWEASENEIADTALIGQWRHDKLFRQSIIGTISEDMEDCNPEDIKGVLQELNSVLTRVRMFRYKPDGDQSLSRSVDANGFPVQLMQDPIHYPHGTKFMAPGPMGQCFPIPESPPLHKLMMKQARNHKRIYDMYNLDEHPKPGTDLFRAYMLEKMVHLFHVPEWMVDELKADHAERMTHQAFFRGIFSDGGGGRRLAQKVDRQAALPEDASPPADGQQQQKASQPHVFASMSQGLGRAMHGISAKVTAWRPPAIRIRSLMPPGQ